MRRRISVPAAVAIAIPALVAGALLGMLLRTRTPGSAPAAARCASTVVDAPRHVPAPGLPAPEPQDPKSPSIVADAPAPLAARLKEFGVLWRELEIALKNREGDPAEFYARFLTLDSRLRPWWEALRPAVLKDPDAYAALLRSPENEEFCKGLLCLLCQTPTLLGGDRLMNRSACPKPILEALQDLLASGTEVQRLALIDLIRKNSEVFKVDLVEPESLVRTCRLLLSAGNPALRISAVGVLQSCDAEAGERQLGIVQGVWQETQDPDLRSQCLQALGHLKGDEAKEFLFKAIRQVLDDRDLAKDDRVQSVMLGIVRDRVITVKAEEADRYAAICSAALGKPSRPEFFTAWLEASLNLPLPSLGQVLEQARAEARTPEQQASVDRVLEEVRAGETRRDRLREALQKQP